MVEHCKKLAIEYQTKPKQEWSLIKRLGTMNGGLNTGISKVECKEKQPGMVFIEKRFGPREFRQNIPHREIQMLHQISDHANIPRMVDHFIDAPNRTAAVYLEYCDLGSLENVVMQVAHGKHVNEHKVWNWFIQLTEALVYCHRGPKSELTDDEITQSDWSRVFHRDIKPANILLTTENGQIVAKLADFGCAISEDYIALDSRKIDAIRQSAWTDGYDAPEHPFFSGTSDVWQLGISMVCLCTGNLHPRSRHNPKGQPWDIGLPAGSKYSLELSSCLNACLVTDRNRRFTVYPVLQLLEKQYKALSAQVPADAMPLEIFDRNMFQAPRSARFPMNQQQMPYQDYPLPNQQPGFYQYPVGPGRPGLASPRAGNMENPVNDHGYPNAQMPFPGGRPRRRDFM
ncbi:kinase-like protein [Decorospora gaudefroyi]|uniref:non-specific serine/threonine protein kinase n=1 Tax=Decorospora gaudefroyi TaxID=184978 RepID=A0A6A5KA80_9PLEO|nr:kinase-like protein [Decorospora gaudefroyi]